MKFTPYPKRYQWTSATRFPNNSIPIRQLLFSRFAKYDSIKFNRNICETRLNKNKCV